MSFWRYVFSFLYVRNWYNGQWELSRPRVALFVGLLFLLGGALLAIMILHAPLEFFVR